jgi:hypothetical protein
LMPFVNAAWPSSAMWLTNHAEVSYPCHCSSGTRPDVWEGS